MVCVSRCNMALSAVQLTSPLVGKFNAYNILAACGAALSYGLDWKTIAGAIANSPARAGAV